MRSTTDTANKYRRIIGGISWPVATQPGWIIILGESITPDFSIVGSPHTYHEIDSCCHVSIDHLSRMACKMSNDHPSLELYGDTTSPIFMLWTALGGPTIYKAQFCEDPGDLNFYGQLILKLISEPRQLLFNRENDIDIDGELLVGMQVNDVTASNRATDYPLVAAIGHAAIELELNKPIVAKIPHIFDGCSNSNGWMAK